MIKVFKKYLIQIILTILGLVAFYKGIFLLDPDFGWHLQEGALELQKGILKTDPFSYTMPSYPFIDHEWLSNIIINIFYTHFGYVFLSLIFAIIFVLALFFAIPKKYSIYCLIPLSLAGALMANFAGIRTQVETLLFFAILLKVILDDRLFKKWKFFIPLLFVCWVNFHGGFAMGIAVLFVFFLAKSAQLKKIALPELAVFLISIIATFVNPYGIRIWYEIWTTVSDLSLSSKIAEWMPGVFNFDLALCTLFVISTFFIFTYRKNYKLYELTIYSFLVAMAILHSRHIPLWAISTIILVPKALVHFYKEVNKKKESKLKFEKIKKLLTLCFLLIFVYEISLSVIYVYNLDRYPKKAVAFLKTQNIKGNIFATYDVGGYLIWKLPGKKVFIDGRMPSWRRQGFYPNESNYAFEDYKNMVNESFFKKELLKYKIDYVLLPKPIKVEKSRIIQKSDFLNRILFSGNSFDKKLLDNPEQIGMTKVYEDVNYVIYKK